MWTISMYHLDLSWASQSEPPVSQQSTPEHTSLLPTRHARALGNGHNWHQAPHHSPFPLWGRHTGGYGRAVPHPGYYCWEISTGSMDPCIHRWISNERGDQRRSRYTGLLPRRTESLSKRGRGKALLQLPCINRSPHTGCLYSAGLIVIIIIIAFKGAMQDFLQSPHSTANCLQHARSSGPGAIMRKSCAAHRALITCKCHVTCHLVRRDSSAIKFDRVEIAFIWALFYWLNH